MSDNHSAAAWIPDGYSQTCYIQAVPELYPDVRFVFRPILVLTQAEINKEFRSAGDDGKKQQWIAAKWMSQQILEWDITKPGGDPVNHTDIQELLRLRPALFSRLWGIINGSDAGDVDETRTPYEMHAAAQRELAMAHLGKTGDDVDAGNS